MPKTTKSKQLRIDTFFKPQKRANPENANQDNIHEEFDGNSKSK